MESQVYEIGFMSVSTERFPGHQTDFSELEKALADPKQSLPPSHSKPLWPEYHPMARLAMAAGHSSPGKSRPFARFSQYCLLPDAGHYALQNSLKLDTSLPRDLPSSRRDRAGWTNFEVSITFVIFSVKEARQAMKKEFKDLEKMKSLQKKQELSSM